MGTGGPGTGGAGTEGSNRGTGGGTRGGRTTGVVPTGGTRTGTRELWTYAGPAHYYTHKEAGAWGFAQSGGIGGVFASLDSLKRMMPQEALWPPTNDTWSLHTVIQGIHYFDALFAGRRAAERWLAEEFQGSSCTAAS